jgi:hypothetical protein
MLSFAILVHSEVNEIERLLDILNKNKSSDDEIVILQDSTAPENTILKIKTLCDKYNVDVYTKKAFTGNFAKQKNLLNGLCSKEWIVNLDADEYISDKFITSIKEIIKSNIDIDTIKLPRINIIEDASTNFLNIQQRIPGYGWVVNEHNHINFPDYQERIYKNNNIIEWKGDVHEVISGAVNKSAIPADYQFKDYFIYHPKNINKQFLQNYNYLNIMEDERFKQSYDMSVLYSDYKDEEVDFVINNKKEETIVILNKNYDYSFDSLDLLLSDLNNKQIIWITDNFPLYTYLDSFNKKNKNIQPYFLEIAETPSNSEFYYTINHLKTDIYRICYTIDKNNKTSIVKKLFNLEKNYFIL